MHIQQFEKEIKKLEQKIYWYPKEKCKIGGSILSKALVDTNLLINEKVKLPKKHEQYYVTYILGIGMLNAPKIFGYGLTIAEALQNVKRKINVRS
jgi:hypothetical protein